MLIKGLGFALPWLLLLGSLTYRLRRRPDQNSDRLDVAVFFTDLLRAVIAALAALPRVVRRPHLPNYPHLPSRSLPQRRSVLAMDGRPGKPRFRIPRRRTPRERIIRSYDVVARRAERRGAPTPPGQVPGELAAAVTAMMPSAGEDVHALARRYLEVRYSRREAGSASANEAEAASKRLCALLR